jgi:hypothetical protein
VAQLKKGQGFAVGALVAAAFMLRPMGFGPAPATGPPVGGAEMKAPIWPALQVGPWVASCNYWAPVRKADEEGRAEPPAEVHGNLGKHGDFTVHIGLDATEEKEAAGCSSGYEERWGFPDGANVTAIIATVPDPVHTHLALAFDRTVDAILQAAQDNNYVGTYHWLPWKTRGSGLKLEEPAGDLEPGHDPERERQPGLMILKPAGAKLKFPESFYDVTYVFLIAETPSQGVDGFQLQNAFLYEAELGRALKKHGGRFSTGAAGHLSIIGPQYSGSAPSLRAGIDAAQKKCVLDAAEIDITGIATTSFSANQISPAAHVHYLSFGDKEDFETSVLIHRIDLSKYEGERVAILAEDNTTFGNVFGSVATNHEILAKGIDVIDFPREISLLRNAHVAESQTGAASSEAFSPYLHFSLKDHSAQDTMPQFSRENSPLSQEAVLMTIARHLRRIRAQFIVSG